MNHAVRALWQSHVEMECYSVLNLTTFLTLNHYNFLIKLTYEAKNWQVVRQLTVVQVTDLHVNVCT